MSVKHSDHHIQEKVTEKEDAGSEEQSKSDLRAEIYEQFDVNCRTDVDSSCYLSQKFSFRPQTHRQVCPSQMMWIAQFISFSPRLTQLEYLKRGSRS